MPADVQLDVRVELAAGAIPTDISERVRQVSLRYGRERGLYSTSTGRCDVLVDTSDDWLTPGGRSAVSADDLHGGQVVITAEVSGRGSVSLYQGWIDDVLWRGSDTSATATLRCVDGFARLAQADISADLPAELTGERVSRLLDLAGYPSGDARQIDDGTVMCQPGSVAGTALDLLRRCAITERGRLGIDHTRSPGGVLVYQQRGLAGVVAAVVSDTPSGADLTPDAPPQTEQDPQLLTNSIDLTLPTGRHITAADQDSISRYGLQHRSIDVYGHHDEMVELAEWWLDTYARSYFQVRRLPVAPHFEDPLAALIALQTTTGDVVRLTYTPSGSPRPVSSLSVVDGVSLTASALDPLARANEVRVAWSLAPSETSRYWVLGDADDGRLSETTRLAPPTTALDGTTRRNVPGGRIRWPPAAAVSAATYSAALTSQVLTSYDSLAARGAAETDPQPGQASIVSTSSGDVRLAVWTGRRWTTQLTT